MPTKVAPRNSNELVPARQLARPVAFRRTARRTIQRTGPAAAMANLVIVPTSNKVVSVRSTDYTQEGVVSRLTVANDGMPGTTDAQYAWSAGVDKGPLCRPTGRSTRAICHKPEAAPVGSRSPARQSCLTLTQIESSRLWPLCRTCQKCGLGTEFHRVTMAD